MLVNQVTAKIEKPRTYSVQRSPVETRSCNDKQQKVLNVKRHCTKTLYHELKRAIYWCCSRDHINPMGNISLNCSCL